MANLAGVDVSKWQAGITWSQVKGAGITFAIIKATEGGLTPGTSDITAINNYGLDPRFRANWAGARAAGLIRGAYHFARPDLGSAPNAEAAWFLSVVGNLQTGDLLALDMEPTPAGNWSGWVKAWLAYVHSHTGVWPFFYTYRYGFSKYGINFSNIGGQAGLWLSAPDLATPPPAMAGWPFVAIWQRANRPCAGIPGVPDSDVFLGERAQLLKYGKQAPVVVPTPTPTPPPVPVPTPGPVPAPTPPTPPVVDPIPIPPPTPPDPVPDPSPEAPPGGWTALIAWLKRILGIA